jgi:two-component system response regulator
MQFLRKQQIFARAPRPDLVLLDMELPKKDGRQVLAEIRSSEELRKIPVVVLTGSAVSRVVLQAEDLRVDGFMTKPVSLDQFIQAVKMLRRSVLAELVLPAGSPLQGAAK